jgi:hypothetical protein
MGWSGAEGRAPGWHVDLGCVLAMALIAMSGLI